MVDDTSFTIIFLLLVSRIPPVLGGSREKELQREWFYKPTNDMAEPDLGGAAWDHFSHAIGLKTHTRGALGSPGKSHGTQSAACLLSPQESWS
jgi:hypothetical protein